MGGAQIEAERYPTGVLFLAMLDFGTGGMVVCVCMVAIDIGQTAGSETCWPTWGTTPCTPCRPSVHSTAWRPSLLPAASVQHRRPCDARKR